MYHLMWVVMKKSALIILEALGMYILNHLPGILMKVVHRAIL